MEIRDCIIVTNGTDPIRMDITELPNFVGNRVFSRDALPIDVVKELKLQVDFSKDVDPTSSNAMSLQPTAANGT